MLIITLRPKHVTWCRSNLSSFPAPNKKTKKWWQASRLVDVFCTWRKESKDDDELPSSLSSFITKKKCKKWQSAKRLVIIFYNWSKTTKDDDKLGSRLVIIFCTWRNKPRNINEPPNSLSSFAPKKKKPRDDNKPLGSLSFSTLEKKTKKWRQASWLIVIFYTWKKKPRNDNKPPSTSSFFTLEEKTKKGPSLLFIMKKKCTKWQQAKRLIVLFYNLSKTIKDGDKSRSWLFVIFCTWGKKPRDDDKPPGLLSSSIPKKKTKRWWQASRLVIIFCT